MVRTGARAHGGAVWARRLAVAVPLCVCVSVPAWSQCPDGTPPPCAARVARAAAPAPNSVAVLYFDNLSRDTSNAYLADGLTEEIIAELGKVRRLDVKSLYASQQIRGKPVTSSAALGRALGAAFLLRGSVRPAAGRVHVTYELIRAATGAHAAGDVLDRAGAELASTPGDIAAAVATAVAGDLRPDERAILARRPTGNADAHDLYLRALHAADSWSQQGPRAAIDYLDRALALDPDFANAYAAKAVAIAMLADAFESPREAYVRVREAAAAALLRDSSSALAWAMLGVANLNDGDMDQAAAFGQRAIALDPHLNWGHILLGTARVAGGRPGEGVPALRRAWEVDSLDAVGAVALLWGFHFAAMDESLAVYLPRMRAALDSESETAYRGMLSAARGDWGTAAATLSWRYYGGFVAGMLVRALVATGHPEAARATVDSMLAARTRGYYNPVALAKAYAALGDRDRAFAWLDRAREDQTMWLIWLRVDPEWAPLRADSRFAALERQLRF